MNWQRRVFDTISDAVIAAARLDRLASSTGPERAGGYNAIFTRA
jgi:hypothetical protein